MATITSIATALPIEESLAIKCATPEMLPKPTHNILCLRLFRDLSKTETATLRAHVSSRKKSSNHEGRLPS